MSNDQQASSVARGTSVIGVIIATAIVVLGMVYWQASVALLVWATDGFFAVSIVIASTLVGCALLPVFGLKPLEMRWRLLLSCGLGLGIVSLLVLAFGLLGLVGSKIRLLLPAIVLLVAFVGVWRLSRVPDPVRAESSAGPFRWLMVAVGPFAALGLLVATIPPGLLWQEEGNGYDVLEYHLQLPREYYENGVISYLPHNVYANFPSAAEMLYLFADSLGGNAVESWPIAKCLNALLAVGVVAAVWLAVREVSPRSGIVAAVLAASTGWLVYLSGVAYVENGMLFLGVLAAGCVIRGCQFDERSARNRWLLFGGVLAGLSCGFKYPAVVMIAFPLAVVPLVVVRERMVERLRGCVLFGVAGLLAFSPWLLKNVIMTGNPVFPLANGVFKAYPEGWGPDESANFASGHAPSEEEARLSGRLAAMWRHIPRDPSQRFGAVMLALAAIGVLRRRGRVELALLTVVIIQLLVWLFATHLYARFAVPMLIPLLLLAGRAVADRVGQVSLGFVVLVLAGAMLNFYNTTKLYAAHIYPSSADGRLCIEGVTEAFTGGYAGGWEHLKTINGQLDGDVRILMVADARMFYVKRPADYCVVFNKNPFAEAVRTSKTVEEIIDWLRNQGYTHVYVDWMEMSRLRNSRYGFPAPITRPLFDQLMEEGLVPLESYRHPSSSKFYSTLYRVPDEVPASQPEDSSPVQ